MSATWEHGARSASGSTRSRVVAAIAAAAALVTLGLTGCGGDESTTDEAAFPDVELTGADDATVSTASWVGEPLVVNFWYSTCPPCARELGEFAEVHDERGGDARFVGVNPMDSVDDMTAFAAERGVDYELFRDELGELQIDLGITSFPSTVFVDANGSVTDITGVLDADGLRSELDDLLDAPDTAEADTEGEAALAPDDEDGWYGIRRDPAPRLLVDELPSLGGEESMLTVTPEAGRLSLVYFGFTNCPDVCPTTMSDLSLALRRLGEQADLVDVVMVSVDPDRDHDHLLEYVHAFVPDGRAVATDDLDLVRRFAEPLGATWDVRTLDDGTVEVDHTPFLYAIDDAGRLALTWQFGTSSEHLADDIARLLDADADAVSDRTDADTTES